MQASFKKSLASGNLFIWGCAGAVSISLLMVFGLLLLIMIRDIETALAHPQMKRLPEARDFLNGVCINTGCTLSVTVA